MTSGRIFILAPGLLIMARGSFFVFNPLAPLQEEQRRLDKSAAQMHADLAAHRREHETALRELAAAEKDLAELKQLAGDTDTNDAQRRTEIKVWLGRMKKLKRLFAAHRDQSIPEMQLLTDEDWLRLASKTSLDPGENLRDTFAAVRSEAKWKFGRALAAAQNKFLKNNHGELPPTTLALAPYLESGDGLDAWMLARYEMTASGKAEEASKPGRWSIEERMPPLDPERDTRLAINPRGAMASQPAPEAWIPDFSTRRNSAEHRFAEANQGRRPATTTELVPYFDPPLEPHFAEKILQAERRRATQRGWSP
jgi:hypothetical protein